MRKTKTTLLKCTSRGSEGCNYNLKKVSTGVNDTMYSLTAEGLGWGEDHRGKRVASVHDNGDWLSVVLEGVGVIKLDYSQAPVLRLLLNEWASEPMAVNEYERYRRLK